MSTPGTSGEWKAGAHPTPTPLTTGVVLFAVALSLRPDLIGVGPLLGFIQEDLGISASAAGLVAALPIVAIGAFSPVAAALGRRIGAERVLLLGLVLIGCFGLARSASPNLVVLLLLTIGSGAGIALAQTLLPVLVKTRAPDHIALLTTVYVVGIQVGAAGGAALSALTAPTLGWRWPLAAFGLLASVLGVVWLAFSRCGGRPTPHLGSPSMSGRLVGHRIVWLLVPTYGLQSFVFFGSSAWTAAFLQEQGMAPGPAGTAVTLLNLAGLFGSLSTPTLLRRTGSIRTAMMGGGSLAILGLGLMVLFPAAGLPLAFVAGLGMGPLLPLVLQLPARVADDPGDVGSVSGIMLGFGYLIAAAGPVVLGALHDVVGSYAWVMVAMMLVMASFVALATSLTETRLRRGVRQRDG